MQFPPLAAAPAENGVSSREGTIETSSEDASDLEEYKVFAAAFKAQREKMAGVQSDRCSRTNWN